jgi:hypothetical protein
LPGDRCGTRAIWDIGVTPEKIDAGRRITGGGAPVVIRFIAKSSMFPICRSGCPDHRDVRGRRKQYLRLRDTELNGGSRVVCLVWDQGRARHGGDRLGPAR